jgi:DNA modification methylase
MSFAERARLTAEIHRLFEQKHGVAHKSAGGHSLLDTANLISKSRETVRQDIELAKAIEQMPEIGQAKNRTEALRIWNKNILNELHSELAKRLEEREIFTDADKRKLEVSQSYVIGDFFEKVKAIPDGTIHLCEVDPPYGIDLGNVKKGKYEKGYALNAYNEIRAESYIPFLQKTIHECYRILVPNGWLLFWFAMEPWFEVVYRELVAGGFELKRVTANWSKVGGSFQSRWPEFELSSSYEMFFYARKGLATLNRPGRANTFAFNQVPATKKIHPTERPVELMQAILDTFCLPGSRIVVPFAGSGNTLLAAANLGMPAVGWDLSDEYHNSFVVRANDTLPGLYRSYKEEQA